MSNGEHYYQVAWSTGSIQGCIEDGEGRQMLYRSLRAANAAARAEFAAMAESDAIDLVTPRATFHNGAISLTDGSGSAPDLAVWVEETTDRIGKEEE